MGTLGAGFPTALGAKIGNPDTTVVALVGDGGFMYSAPELATAVQYGINVVTVIFNNHAYGASISDQESQFNGRVVGTELQNPDFALMAESFGAKGMHLTDVKDLPAAIEEAIASHRPTVIDVETPRLEPPYQMLPPSR
jgi:acetolactate synthase-1/2/3 large subunit